MANVEKKTVLLGEVCIRDGAPYDVFNTKTDEVYKIDSSNPSQCDLTKPLTLQSNSTDQRSSEVGNLFQRLSIFSLEGQNLKELAVKDALQKKDYRVYGLFFDFIHSKRGRLDPKLLGEVKKKFTLKELGLKIADRLVTIDLYTIPQRLPTEGSVYLKLDRKGNVTDSKSRLPDQKVSIGRRIIRNDSGTLIDSPETEAYYALLNREFSLPEIFSEIMGDLLTEENGESEDQVIYLSGLKEKIRAISVNDFRALFLQKIEDHIKQTQSLIRESTISGVKVLHQGHLIELKKLKRFIESIN